MTTARYEITETSHRGAAGATDPAAGRQLRYWVGASITALIAALTALIGMVVARDLLHIPLATGAGTPGLSTVSYGVGVVGIALLAAGLFDGMLQVAPRPAAYYGWLTAVITVLAGLLPFTLAMSLHAQLALALTNVAVGIMIAVGMPLAADNAER